jgi:hypothetical protein
VRLLFLGNSDDLNPETPEEQRAPHLCAQFLSEATGQPCEVIARVIWPSPDLPDLLDRWLDRYEPDLVLFKITWFWYGYESVPIRIERVLGRLGRPIAGAGLRAAATPALGHSRPFKLGRRMAHRLIGGDSPFTPTQVIEITELCLRRVIAREGTIVVAKGTATYDLAGEVMIADYKPRFAARRNLVEGSLEAFCNRLRIQWADNRNTGGVEHEGIDLGDGLHKIASVQETFARLHARDLKAAIEAAGGMPDAPARNEHGELSSDTPISNRSR